MDRGVIFVKEATIESVNIQILELYRPVDPPAWEGEEPTSSVAPRPGTETLSTTTRSTDRRIGFLQTCIDRRFVGASRQEFEQLTDLNSTEYYHESYAGGSARESNPIGTDPETGESIDAADYAYKNGARTFGWQAHFNTCGGLPGLENRDIEEKLIGRVKAWAQTHPDTQNFLLLASEKKTLSTTTRSTDLQIGFLRTCMDRRFVGASRQEFEQLTGLNSTEYYHESYAGGSAREPNPIGTDPETGESIDAADYAYKNGAVFFGWQAHLNTCGGLPNFDDKAINDALNRLVEDMARKYPNARHFLLLASENPDGRVEITTREIHSSPEEPVTVVRENADPPVSTAPGITHQWWPGINRERQPALERAEKIKCALAIGGLTLTGSIFVGAAIAGLIILDKKITAGTKDT